MVPSFAGLSPHQLLFDVCSAVSSPGHTACGGQDVRLVSCRDDRATVATKPGIDQMEGDPMSGVQIEPAAPFLLQPAPTVASVADALRQRADTLAAAFPRDADGEELRRHCRALASGELLIYSATSARDRLLVANDSGRLSSALHAFSDWLVATSAFPWAPPRVPGGYLALLTAVSEAAYERPDGRHVAHWSVFEGEDGLAVHLAIIPDRRSSVAPVLLPWALLSAGERRLVRLPTFLRSLV